MCVEWGAASPSLVSLWRVVQGVCQLGDLHELTDNVTWQLWFIRYLRFGGDPLGKQSDIVGLYPPGLGLGSCVTLCTPLQKHLPWIFKTWVTLPCTVLELGRMRNLR